MRPPIVLTRYVQLCGARSYCPAVYSLSSTSSFLSAALSPSCSSGFTRSPLWETYRYATVNAATDVDKQRSDSFLLQKGKEGTYLHIPHAPSSPLLKAILLRIVSLCETRYIVRNEDTKTLLLSFARHLPVIFQYWSKSNKERMTGADAARSATSQTCSDNNSKEQMMKPQDMSSGFPLEGVTECYTQFTTPPPKSSPERKGKLPNKQEERKVADKTGGSGDEGNSGRNGNPPEGDADDWALIQSIRIIWFIVAISFLCWYFGKPRGKQVGWATLMKHVGEIEFLELYDSYAQVTLISPAGKKTYFCVGLVDESHTNAHVGTLRSAYAEGRKKALTRVKSHHSEEREASVENQEHSKETVSSEKHSDTASNVPTQQDNRYELFRHENLQVVWNGTLKSEKCLRAIGTVAWIFPFLFFPAYVIILSASIMRASLPLRKMLGNAPLQNSKTSFKVEPPSDTKFCDVAGMKEAKGEILEIVDFLRHPKRYTALGAKIPTGALLLGPPGTGKTLLAKAVSGESGVSFIPVCGSDFIEEYFGMGAKRIRELFKLAQKQRTIIYIDEIDAIGLKRQQGVEGGKMEQEHTLNELLSQLDGFASKDHVGDIIVIASSNVSVDLLDSALIRPGRFDRIIHVDTPVKKERAEIFKVHLSKLKVVPEQPSSTALPSSTEGTSSGSEDENLGPKTSSDTSVVEEENIVMTAIPEKEIAEILTKTKMSLVIAVPSATENQNKPSDAAPVTEQPEKAVEEEDPPTVSPTPTPETNEKPVEPLSPTPVTLSTCTALIPFPSLTAEAFTNSITSEEKEKTAPPYPESPMESIIFMFQQKSKEEQGIIDAYADRMSELCPGCVGADMANMCNEAAILAVQEDAPCVTINHLERSIDRVIAGIEHRSRVLSDFEKKVVAHHEAGHAVAGWFLQRANPLMKVSIIPRSGSALGYAQYLPPENRNQTAYELRDSIAVTLGGRIAEQIFFNHLSTGASDDLEKVKSMAYFYVSSFNDRERGIGGYPTPDSEEMRYRKLYGEEKANAFDELARKIVDKIYEETYTLLLEHKSHMSLLAEHLLKEEVLTHVDVVHYLGARPKRENDRKSLKELLRSIKEK